MSDLNPVGEIQRQKDNENLKLLSVFHFVLAGLSLVVMAFIALHYFFMRMMFTNPAIWEKKAGESAGPPPEFIKEFFEYFVWVYVFSASIVLVSGMANVFSGMFLRKKKHHTFSLVVAGLNCAQMPFDTAVGVFTLVVLLRESVKEGYARVVQAGELNTDDDG